MLHSHSWNFSVRSNSNAVDVWGSFEVAVDVPLFGTIKCAHEGAL